MADYELRTQVTVSLTVEDVSRAFADMDDDAQARFFVEVARIMTEWTVVAGATIQAHYIGRHLRTCECSTEDAREFVRNIASAMETRDA